MSRIFDALQRAEEDRRGVAASSRLAATELLESAEREIRTHPTFESRTATIADTPHAPGDATELAGSAKPEAPLNPTAEPIRRAPPEVETLHLASPFHNRLVALSDSSTPAAEAFRLLCVRLRHLRKDRPLRSLLISSTSPGDGKSFAAANLACTLAAGWQQNVLVLEGDVRQPSLGEIFQLEDRPGLCEYLHGKRKLTESFYRLEEAGLWILPAGLGQTNTPELLESAPLTAMTAQLSQWFDWIVIDSPPVLPLADTSVWEKVADGLLLVARRGVSTRRKLKRGAEAVDPKKLIGAILNCSNRSTHDDYYEYRRPPANADAEEVLQGSR